MNTWKLVAVILITVSVIGLVLWYVWPKIRKALGITTKTITGELIPEA